VRLGAFYARRSLRIFPLYYVVLGFYALRALQTHGDSVVARHFLDGFVFHATYTANWFLNYAVPHPVMFAFSWSLCVEEHFYLFFPLLAWWLTRRPSSAKFAAVCIAIVCFGMAIRGYVWLHELAPVRNVEGIARDFGQRFIEDIYYPTYTRLDGLLAGVVLATIRAYRPALWAQMEMKANAMLLAGIGIAAGAIWIFQDRTGFAATVLGYPLLSTGLALLVAAGASTHGWMATIKVPGAGWLAVVSYSLYLTHKAVYHLVETNLLAWWDARGMFAFAIYAASALAAGAALHHGVERPFLRLRDRWRAGAALESTTDLPLAKGA
jgi:peptidoglycan/LPS O-acetylase OafA/YrhL